MDEGDYSCEASNIGGSVSCSARLKIGNPPRIDRLPGDLYLPEGDNTKIKIYFSGDQPMDVSLTKDGREIVETVRNKYTVFDEYLIIFIKEITKSDAGQYTLRIKNDSGDVSASFTVTAPTGPLEVSDITQHKCTLNWKPPSYDGGKRITHYVVERHDTSHTHWITFTVQGLTEGQKCLFRFMAANNPIKAKAPALNRSILRPLRAHRTSPKWARTSPTYRGANRNRMAERGSKATGSTNAKPEISFGCASIGIGSANIR